MPTSLAESQQNDSLYDRDFYEWTRAQARALRKARPVDLDWGNVSEEIESLGRSDKRSIASNLNVIILHLLKWRYQASKQKAGLRASIAEHRTRVRELIEDSPSLRRYPSEILEREYGLARLKAVDETELPESELPATCPFAIGQILDPDFWPDATSG